MGPSWKGLLVDESLLVGTALGCWSLRQGLQVDGSFLVSTDRGSGVR